MIFLYAFLVSGSICLIGQLILDLLKLTPAHLTGIFVSLGAILEYFKIYDKLIDFSEAGALVPITSYGHLLAKGTIEMVSEKGIIGVGLGMFEYATSGLVYAIVFAFVAALIFKPRG